MAEKALTLNNTVNKMLWPYQYDSARQRDKTQSLKIALAAFIFHTYNQLSEWMLRTVYVCERLSACITLYILRCMFYVVSLRWMQYCCFFALIASTNGNRRLKTAIYSAVYFPQILPTQWTEKNIPICDKYCCQYLFNIVGVVVRISFNYGASAWQKIILINSMYAQQQKLSTTTKAFKQNLKEKSVLKLQ